MYVNRSQMLDQRELQHTFTRQHSLLSVGPVGYAEIQRRINKFALVPDFAGAFILLSNLDLALWVAKLQEQQTTKAYYRYSTRLQRSSLE